MNEKPLPEDEDAPAPDEELIAYLDGELDVREAGAVEARLAADEAARTKAESFRKTYELLEYLPTPEPSPTFTSRTLTKLDAIPSHPGMNGAVRANASAVSHPMLPAPRSWVWNFAAWALAAIVALGVGYFGHLLAKPHLENRGAVPRTSEQARLLERLPLYLGVDDLAFVQKLDDAEYFGDTDGEPEAAAPAATSDTVTTTELAKLEDVYRKLPPARQQQLRQLDEDFFALPPAQQAKLNGVLERYAVWLDRLPENYRKEVLSAPVADERLDAVRRVLKRQWRESLPASVKARVAEAADVEERDRIYADYRRDEAVRRSSWELARKEWVNARSDRKPFPFDNPDLTKQVDDFVTTVLKPRLRLDESVRLEELRRDAVQGSFMAQVMYGAFILYMAEAHPSLPEPRSGKLVLKVDDLPGEFIRKLRTSPSGRPNANKRELKDWPQHGKWPDFAEAVAREAQDRNVPVPFAFGPAKPGEFKPEVDEVLTTLRSRLNAKESTDLDALQGKWPQYPKQFLFLAQRHDLAIPGVTLPGSPHQWAKVYHLRPKR